MSRYQKFSKLLRRMSHSENGNVAIIFALSIIPIVGMIGLIVDYASALSARTKMQSALDSAVVVAAKEYHGIDENKTLAESKARLQYAAAAKQGAQGSITQSSFGGNTVTLTATGNVPTSFMSVMGFNQIEISATSKASMAGKDLELSVMLDVTGSMWRDIGNLRAAGQDLIDIILTPSSRPRRMAVVPFAQAVNVGNYFQAVTGLPRTQTQRVCTRWRHHRCRRWQNRTVTRSPCAVARRGAYKNTDEAPAANRYFGSYDDERQYSNNYYIRQGYACNPSSSSIIPLTNDRQVLRAAMTGLQANGSTAGHIGTLWAWQMLSPKWSSVWPSASTPGAYDPTRLMKVAILMTDGQYNTWYRAGGTSNTQAEATCTAMKNQDIVVYTIGFHMAGQTSAINLLKRCATSNAHYFFPYDGNALRQVFRTIGGQIADGADGITLAR